MRRDKRADRVLRPQPAAHGKGGVQVGPQRGKAGRHTQAGQFLASGAAFGLELLDVNAKFSQALAVRVGGEFGAVERSPSRAGVDAGALGIAA